MKVDRENRTLIFSELPTSLDGSAGHLPSTLRVALRYFEGDDAAVIDKAISLDNVVIPAIVRACNIMGQAKW